MCSLNPHADNVYIQIITLVKDIHPPGLMNGFMKLETFAAQQ